MNKPTHTTRPNSQIISNELRNRLIPKQHILTQTVTLNSGFKRKISKPTKSPHLPNTPAIPPLPEIPSKPPSQPKEVNDDGSYDAIFSKMKSPFEFIDYARKHNLKKEYIYLVPSGELETAELPTNLVPISQKDVVLKIPMNERDRLREGPSSKVLQEAGEKLEFWNLSLEGLTHVKGNIIDFTPLDEWLQSIDHFKRLMQIPFFKYQREWRMFSLWKKYVQRGKMYNAQIGLSSDLFFANNIIQPAFIQVQRQIYDIKSVKLFSLRSDGNYTLDQFAEENFKYKDIVEKKFRNFYQNLIKIVQDACEKIIDTLSSPERQMSTSEDEGPLDLMIAHYKKTHSKAATLSNTEAVQNLAYTQKASHKATCEKLIRFIRLVDYVVISALRNICFNSLLEFFSVIKFLYDNGAKQVDFKSPNEITDLNLSPEFTKLYEMIKARTSEMFNAPIFLIDVSYENGLKYTPTARNIIDKIEQVRNEFIDILFKVPRLIVNPSFTPLHTAGTNEAIFNPDNVKMLDLGQIIFNDELFKETTSKQNTVIFSAFNMLQFFSREFNRAIDVYEEEQHFDISFMKKKGCNPSKIKQKIQDILEQEELLKKIVEKNNVGLFCAQTKAMKSLFLTAPGRCLEMIRRYIPKVTNRNLDEFESSVMKAHSALKSEITNVPEFVSYISAIEQYKENINLIIKHSEMIESFFKLATTQGIYFSEDQHNKFVNLKSLLEESKKALAFSTENRNALTPKFAEELDESIAKLHARVKAVMEIANNVELFKIETTCSRAATILVTVIAGSDEMLQMATSYNEYKEKMGKPKVKFEDVQKLSDLVTYEQLLWETLTEWNVKMGTWMNMRFTDIDTDNLHDEIVEFKEKSKTILKSERKMKLFKNNEINPVSEKLDTMIDNFSRLVPVIVNLNNPALKEEHKKSIDARLGEKIFENNEFHINKLYECNAFDQGKAIENITAHASNEKHLLDMLQSVKVKIDDMKFYIIQGKNQRNYLGGIHDIITTIEDAKATIAAIRTSRYIAQLLSNADDWMKTLRTFSRTIKKIQYCQSIWDFVNVILQSGDSIRQIPSSKDINTVDKIFKAMLTRVSDDPSVFRLFNMNQTLPDIEQATIVLERMRNDIYKGLEAKRMVFPRLYFISDAQFLNLISKSKDALSLKPYFSLLFDGIANCEIDFNNHIPSITAISSADGEVLKLRPVKYKPNAEQWLASIDEIVVRTLRNEMKSVFNKSSELVHDVWIEESLGQAGYVISQVLFTTSVQNALMNGNQMADLTNVLHEIRQKIKESLKFMKVYQNRKLSNYITLLCRQEDIVENLININADSPYVNEWKNEIRYTFDTDDKGIIVQQGNYVVKYGYEFYGSSPRIVITPKTSKIFSHATSAINFKYSVLFNGKPGYGQTTILNELARMFGMYFIKIKCTNMITLNRINSYICGIVQGGVWGCFVDTNLVRYEDFSILTQCLANIKDAQIAGIKKITLFGNEVQVSQQATIFHVTSPDPNKKQQLPEYMMEHLRVINMIEFDLKKYIYVKLKTLGLDEIDEIATKCEKILNTYEKYFTERSPFQIINKVFKYMQELLIKDAQVDNESALLYAFTRYANCYLETSQSAYLERICKNLFVNANTIVPETCSISKTIEEMCQKYGIVYKEENSLWFDNAADIFNNHSAVIIVGPHDTGKSSIIKVLKKSLNQEIISKNKDRTIKTHTIYPNALNYMDLFGRSTDNISKSKVGLLEKLLKELNETDRQHWIIFDGFIQFDWIEAIKQSIGEVNPFSLPSGTRLVIPKDTKFVFETTSISQTSPSVLAKCALVPMNDKEVTSNDIISIKIEKYIVPLLKGQRNHIEKFKELCKNAIPQIEQFYSEVNETESIVTFSHCIMSFIDLFVLVVDHTVLLDENTTENMTMLFVFAFVWGFGGYLDEKNRGIFDKITRGIFTNACRLPPTETLFDWYVVKDERFRWVSWSSNVPKFIDVATTKFETNYTQSIRAYNVIVPTPETEKMNYLLNLFMKGNRNILLNGVSGIGKTLVVNKFLKSIDDDDISKKTFLMSYGVQREEFERDLLRSLQIDEVTTLYPTCDKQGIFVLDSLNEPHIDQYGINQTYEMLREILNTNKFRSAIKGELMKIRNVSFIGITMNRNSMIDIDPSIANRMFNITMMPYNLNTEKNIVTSFLTLLYTKGFGDTADIIVDTVNAYKSAFVRNPETPWITFNLHVIGDLLQSMLRSSRDIVKNKAALDRFLTNEIYRTFVDKMKSEDDVKKFTDMFSTIRSKKSRTKAPLNEVLKYTFGELTRTIRYSEEDQQSYQEYESIDDVVDDLRRSIEEFRYSRCNNSADIYIMPHTAKHIVKLTRILRTPKGNAMIIGPMGAGKRTISRFGSFLVDADYIEMDDTPQSLEDLKNHLTRCSVSAKKCVILFTSDSLKNRNLAEIANTLVTGENIARLFTNEEMDKIYTDLVTYARKNGKSEAHPHLYEVFNRRLLENMHVILSLEDVDSDILRFTTEYSSSLRFCTSFYVDMMDIDNLNLFGKEILDCIECFDDESKVRLIKLSTYIYKTVEQEAKSLKKENQMHILSPFTYCRYINSVIYNYENFLDKNESIYNVTNGALVKYNNAAESVEKAKKQLGEINDKLDVFEKEKDTNEELIKMLKEKAESKQQMIKEETDLLNDDIKAANDIIQEIKKEQDPMNRRMKDALKSIKEISAEQIEMLSNEDEETDDVMNCLIDCICIINEMKHSRKNFIALLQDSTFFPMMASKFEGKRVITKHTFKKLNERIEDCKDFNNVPEREEWALLHKFISTVHDNDLLAIKLQPMQQKYQQIIATNRTKRESIKKLSRKLKAIQDKIENEKQQGSPSGEQTLDMKKSEIMGRIQRFNSLDENMKEIIKYWNQKIQKLQEDKEYFLANSALCALYFIYLGIFNSEKRNDIVKKVTNFMTLLKMNTSTGFTFEGCFVDKPTINKWYSLGLPSDKTSIENAIIIKFGQIVPYIVDPDNVCTNWIKNLESSRQLETITPNMPSFIRIIEKSARNGFPCLITEAGDSLDPFVEAFLMRNDTNEGKYLAKVNDRKIEVDSKFTLYIVSNRRNSPTTPEIFTKTTVVSYKQSVESFETMVVSAIIKNIHYDVEEKLNITCETMSFSQNQMNKVEDRLIELLTKSGNSLVDDEVLLSELKDLKNSFLAEKAKIADLEKNLNEIAAKKEEYKKAANTVARCLNIIYNLTSVNKMFVYNVDSISKTLNESLQRMKFSFSSNNFDIGKELSKSIVFTVVDTMSPEYRTFVLVKCISEIRLNDKQEDENKVVELLSLKNPAPASIKSTIWSRLIWIGKQVPSINRFINKLLENVGAFVEYLNSDAIYIPDQYTESISLNHKILISWLFKPETISKILEEVFIEEIGADKLVIKPPSIDDAFNNKMFNTHPMMLLLTKDSSGPGNFIYQTAKAHGISKKFMVITGEGQYKEKTKAAIAEYSATGGILYFPNIDNNPDILSPSDFTSINENFHIIISANESQKLCRIALSSYKIPFRAPSTRESLLQLVETIDEIILTKTKWTRVVYMLMLVQASFMSRGEIWGMFSISYIISIPEWLVLIRGVKDMFDESMLKTEKCDIDFEKLVKFVVEDAYGAVICSRFDRERLYSLLSVIFNQSCLTPQFHMIKNRLPVMKGKNEIMTCIDSIVETSNVGTASKEFNLFSMINLFNNRRTLSAESLQGVAIILNEIKEQIPALDDIGTDNDSEIALLTDPMMIVINKEVNFLNKEIKRIITSIDHLINVCKRLIPYTELDKEEITLISNSLRPKSWDYGNTPLSLNTWLDSLKTHIEFFNSWVRRPKCLPAAAFHSMNTFTHAVKRKISKVKNIDIDDFVVQANLLHAEPAEVPQECTLVSGVALKGALFGITGIVGKAKEFTEIPFIEFSPLMKSELETNEDLIELPVYKSTKPVKMHEFIQSDFLVGTFYVKAQKEEIPKLKECGAFFVIK